MALWPFLPLALTLGLVGLVGLVPVSRFADRVVTRVALGSFGRYVNRVRRHEEVRRRLLRSAHVATVYREYAAKTLFYAAVVATGAAVATVYVVWGVLSFLSAPEDELLRTLPQSLTPLAALGGLEVGLVGTLTTALGPALAVGALAGFLTYWLRWYYPQYVADERARQVDVSMPSTVAFLYALSRSGMAFTEVLRLLAAHENIYGYAAGEVRVAVRDMDLFGVDLVSAVQTMARRSPSGNFREFSENLASVLQTGGSIAEFMRRQHEEYRQEARAQQERILERLATLAEAYVAVAVAGMLFFITLLTIVGVLGIGFVDVLLLLRIVVYLAIPLINLAFITYVATIVDNLSRRDPSEEAVQVRMDPDGIRQVRDLAAERVAGVLDRGPGSGGGSELAAVVGDGDRPAVEADGGTATDGSTATDGGTAGDATAGAGAAGRHARSPDPRRGPGRATPTTGTDAEVRANLERLAAYGRLRELRRRLGSPVRTVVRNPTTLLWVTFPVAVFFVGIRLPLLLSDGVVTVREIDDLVIQSGLFLMGTFAVAYSLHRRRIEAIESVVPDFLDRLASLNEAGMTVVESLGRVRGTELGRLDEELDVVWADIQWGADVETALRRFESRVRTKTISRIVTLMTAAMGASGNLGTVLRIAADQAKADRRLKRKRRQEMFTYLLVVYIAFFVFLFIIWVLEGVLIPNLPAQSLIPETEGAQNAPVPAIGGLGGVDTDAYRLVFLHTVVVQAVCSGFVAGQLSTGDIKAGAKHAAILTAIGYAAFVFLL